jgi:hypothetical protein
VHHTENWIKKLETGFAVLPRSFSLFLDGYAELPKSSLNVDKPIWVYHVAQAVDHATDDNNTAKMQIPDIISFFHLHACLPESRVGHDAMQ